ncbi:MAG: tRNA (adenosine(37)-N6)-threonylcarbamoyltransferase complex ATPase subunit type 1 TsaE [Clostridia bacterium]|nr:tRNA (adenosine(37)-N6)-threonylcarbamoyltransferase complex ATPase subunit type 1 TsaE [Clostridia bacterium]
MIRTTNSELETFALAEEIAHTLRGGEAILLCGTLGAGKTTFTKGLAKALGVTKMVVSPTFTIIKEYQGSALTLYHIDMYRIEDEDELYELGIEELYQKDTITVIEWNKMQELPDRVIRINIDVTGENKRKWEISGLESDNN